MGTEVEASERGATTMASLLAGSKPRRRMDPDLVGTVQPPRIPRARLGARQPVSQGGGGVVYWEGGRGGFHFLDPEHGDICSNNTASGEGRGRLPNKSADRATTAAARRRSTHSASPQVCPPPSPSPISLSPSLSRLTISLSLSLSLCQQTANPKTEAQVAYKRRCRCDQGNPRGASRRKK
jgi:hypothetical protein